MTKQEFFQLHAPQYNFELNADQLIKKALSKKFIVEISPNNYEYTK